MNNTTRDKEVDNYDFILNVLSIINKPKTLKELEMALEVILIDYTQEDKRSIALMLYALNQKKFSGILFKSGVVDLISNRSHKLKTVGDYNDEFDRLYENSLQTVANNEQDWDNGGLKELEVCTLSMTLALYFNREDKTSRSVSMIEVVQMITDVIGGPRNIYWYYITKWSDLGLINYGTSIRYVWFEFKNFEKPGLERYLKILNSIKEMYGDEE